MQVLNPVLDQIPVQNNNNADTPLTVMMVGILPTELNKIKGGVEAVIVNLFEGFRLMPHLRIVHVSLTKEVKEKKTIQYAQNIVIHYLPFKNRVEFVDYVVNGRTIQQIIQEASPDIIHIQEITPHLLRFLKFPKDRIVVTQHGIMHEELKYCSGVGGKLKGLFKVYVERYIFPLFKNVIFISEYNKKLYPSNAVNSGVKIYNPVNPIFFQTASRSDEQPRSLLYVGVLSRRKNIKVVLSAMNELKKNGKHYQLHVAGGFKDRSYEKEIHNLINEYDLKSDVEFYGWVSQDDLQKIYARCPLFILPSQQETLPVSIAEAMAMGKTVIASDVGAVSEMFTDKVSGFLFRKNDKNDLIKVLEFIYEKNSTSDYGDSARREAFEKFHPSTIAGQTVKFYHEIVQRIIAK